MSEKLNIIEAMKMPIGTEFNIVFKNGEKFHPTFKLIESCSLIKFKWEDGKYVEITKDLVEATFIPIQQPVSFMEAINSGKRIKCVHDRFSKSNKYMSVFKMFEHLTLGASDFPLDLINNGKWYIEESEADSNE